MALPLLKLLPSILKTVAKITGIDVVDKAADAIAGTTLTAEKQAELDQAVMQHEVEMKKLAVEEYKASAEVIKTEASSSDAYVRRARPTFLYIMYAALFVNYVVGSVVHLFRQDIVPVNLPEGLLVLFGSGYLGYSYLRTKDKQNGH